MRRLSRKVCLSHWTSASRSKDSRKNCLKICLFKIVYLSINNTLKSYSNLIYLFPVLYQLIPPKSVQVTLKHSLYIKYFYKSIYCQCDESIMAKISWARFWVKPRHPQQDSFETAIIQDGNMYKFNRDI